MTKKIKEIAHYGLTGWVVKREHPPVQISQDPHEAELRRESADAGGALLHASSAAHKPFWDGEHLPAADADMCCQLRGRTCICSPVKAYTMP